MYCFLPALFDSSRKLSVNSSKSSLLGFAHLVQHVRIGVLGSDFQMPADMVLGQFSHVLGRTPCQVHANAAGDQHLLDAGRLAGVCASSAISGP